MRAGKLVHRLVSVEQAGLLRRAIGNYRKLKKLLRAWEIETERRWIKTGRPSGQLRASKGKSRAVRRLIKR